MNEDTTGKMPFVPNEVLMTPFIIGRVAFEMSMKSTILLARLAQTAAQSADTALAKYIQLSEEEMKRDPRKESVRVE
jgi:hypothetical protein